MSFKAQILFNFAVYFDISIIISKPFLFYYLNRQYIHLYSLTDFLDNQRNPSQSMKYFVCISRILSEIEKSSAYLSSLLALMVSLCSFIKLFFSSFNVSKQFLGSSWVYIHILQVTSSHHSLLTPAPALPTIQLFIPTVSPHSDLQRPC